MGSNRLRKDIKDNDRTQKAFFASDESTGGSYAQDALDQQSKTKARLLVFPDAWVKNMESKIDFLTDQCSNQILMVKKSFSSAKKD